MSASTIQRASFGPSLAGEQFTIEKINTDLIKTHELQLCAQAVGDIIVRSWKSKLEDAGIPDHDIYAVVPDELEQMNRIVQPVNNAKYWVAHSGGMNEENIKSPDAINGFIRVEQYRPRNPFKSPYPNVTDLESRGGYLTGTFEKQAAGLLYFALGDFDEERTVAAYELDGSDGIEFYEEYGFTQTGNRPTQSVGKSEVVTIHMVAPSVSLVRGSLVTSYPWLDVTDIL